MPTTFCYDLDGIANLQTKEVTTLGVIYLTTWVTLSFLITTFIS
nr:MAG TPA: hypothetical protein [Caudoviricetes sp.]